MSSMVDVPERLHELGFTAASIERLRDAYWRLSSGFYRIVDMDGRVVPFVPKSGQRRLLRSVFKGGFRRWLIVKARQQGFSTLIALMCFDFCYFRNNVQGIIVDQNQKDASLKLAKCRTAYKKLDALMSEELSADSGSAMGFSNGSIIFAGMNARGGTNHFMHISEFGRIAYEDVARASEICSGALPSVPDNGYCFIESTFMGGRSGLFYDMIKRAEEVPDAQKTAKDFRLLFSPWYEDERCTLVGDVSRVTKETSEYLRHIEDVTGSVFTDGQRLWYQATLEEQGIFMRRENPSVIGECWAAPVKGAIYADEISALRSKGLIYDFEWDRAFPVWTAWDLGWSDDTVIWWFQVRGNRVDFIRCVSLRHHSPAQCMTVVRDAGIPVIGYLVPHDAGHHHAGVTYMGELQRAGATNVKIVSRTPNIWSCINRVRDMLPRCSFNVGGCAEGISALEIYHSREDLKQGVIFSEPVHDASSHIADALRTAVEAIHAGMISSAGAVPGASVSAQARRAQVQMRRPGELVSAISAMEGFS